MHARPSIEFHPSPPPRPARQRVGRARGRDRNPEHEARRGRTPGKALVPGTASGRDVLEMPGRTPATRTLRPAGPGRDD